MFCIGWEGWARTTDHRIQSPLLLPTELLPNTLIELRSIRALCRGIYILPLQVQTVLILQK